MRSRFEIVAVGGTTGSANALMQVLTAMRHLPACPLLATLDEDDVRLDRLVDALVRRGWDAAYAQDGERPRGLRFCPAKTSMTVAQDGRLRLDAGRTMPIDALFTTAARQWRSATAAILLSGSGHDGTNGMLALTAVGGMRLVQSPADAPASSILRSAILNDDPDQILLLHEMAPALDALLSTAGTR